AASAPLVWMVSDLVIAHDALHSLHGTAALADTQDRRRHISQVPYWTLQYFGYTLREPLLVGIPIGLAFAWLYRRRQGPLPLARQAFDAGTPLVTGDHRPIPYLRYWLGGTPGSVSTIEQDASPLGPMLVLPRNVPHVHRFYKKNFPHVTAPAGYRHIYANGSW